MPPNGCLFCRLRASGTRLTDDEVRELNTLFRKYKTRQQWQLTTSATLLSDSVEHIPDCIGKLQALTSLKLRCVCVLSLLY
jgi:hypothetical protein